MGLEKILKAEADEEAGDLEQWHAGAEHDPEIRSDGWTDVPPELITQNPWRPSLEEQEFLDARALQFYGMQRDNLAEPQTISRAVPWDYEYNPMPYRSVRIDEVRKAPYHSRIAQEASFQELLSPYSSVITARNTTSWVHVYDVLEDGHFSEPELAHCRLKNARFYVESLEKLRSRVLQSSVSSDARLIIVEDMLPPVMEILGRSWNLPAVFFKRHVCNAWGGVNKSLVSAQDPRAILRKDIIMLAIPQPALLSVSHEGMNLDSRQSLRAFLSLGSAHLQDTKLWPLLRQQQRRLYCTAYEHLTIIFQWSERKTWQGVIALPPLVDGNSHSGAGGLYEVKKLQVLDASGKSSRGPLFSPGSSWPGLLETASASGRNMRDPFEIVLLLYEQSLRSWTAHLAHVSRSIELISIDGAVDAGASPEGGVDTHQQLRALIVNDLTLLSEIAEAMEDVSTHCVSLRKDERLYRKSGFALQKNLKALSLRFSAIKTALQRFLPTLQGQIEILVTEQQVNLATLQLEETRKSIQQADTIKRLTVLAFIYIPIQTAASIFGMNVRELRDTPSVWTFAVTAVCLLVATVSAALWQRIRPLIGNVSPFSPRRTLARK